MGRYSTGHRQRGDEGNGFGVYFHKSKRKYNMCDVDCGLFVVTHLVPELPTTLKIKADWGDKKAGQNTYNGSIGAV